MDVFSKKDGLPVCWDGQTQQHLHGRRLPGSVASKKTVDPAFFHMHVEVGDAFLVIVLLGQVLRFDDEVVHNTILLSST